MRISQWNKILAGVALAPIPFVGYATVYLTENQAAAALFPGISLTPSWIDLTPEQLQRIKKASGKEPLSPHTRVLWGPQKEALFIDSVLGKHEFIQYAVAITPDGKIKGVEVMDYRETYGYQIREAAWRQNFVGKNAQSPVQLDKDIPNISGATLSSKHVTDGVRRILHTYDVLKPTT